MSAPDLSTARWFKSSYSSNNGTCVETAFLPDAVAVRDSKDPDGGTLIVDAAAWTDFIAGVKAGAFDR